MKTILIITGSVRKRRAADGVLAQVAQAVEASGAAAQVADLRELNLPMFDSMVTPSSPEYVPEYDAVKQLMRDVTAADGVIMLVPEYNGMLSAALKNAYDWAGKAWCETPVAAVGYNWYKGRHGGLENVRFLMDRVGAAMPADDVHLVFGRDITEDGAAIDEVAIQAQLQRLVAQLTA